MQNFYELYDLLVEMKDFHREFILELESMKILIEMDSDRKNSHYLNIKSMKDPNIKGRIKFDSKKDLEMLFDTIQDPIDFLNYVHFNTLSSADAYKLTQIVSREITKLKVKYSEEEYDNLGLEFEVKSQLQKELELQVAAEAEVAEEPEA